MSDHDATRLSLLIVEDNPADVFLVREALEQEGLNCRLQVASDGEQAIHIIDQVDSDARARCPDLLLLDLNIPRRSGDEVLERLRDSRRCSKIPVVIMTSSGSSEDQNRAMRLGATEYFRKPSNLAEFLKIGALLRSVHRAS